MAVHIKNLNIESFRGIRGLALDNLNHVNIIAGDNNSGKTSVLEALMLLRSPMDFQTTLRVARARDKGYPFNNASLYENFLNLFPRNVDEFEISINGICWGKPVIIRLFGNQEIILITPEELHQNSDSATRRVRIKNYPSEIEASAFKGKFYCQLDKESFEEHIEIHAYSKMSSRTLGPLGHPDFIYLSPFEHIRGNVFSKVLRDNQYKEICINILQLFDQKISDLLYLKDEITGRPIEYIRHETLGNMPLSTYGDGIKKVLSLANGIAQAANGVLMIDELETAIHAKYYNDIFRFMAKACKQFQVQLFITTHSMEAIDKLLTTQEYDNQGEADDITVITFKKEFNSAQTLSRTLSGRRVYSNREEFGFEVRL